MQGKARMERVKGKRARVSYRVISIKKSYDT